MVVEAEAEEVFLVSVSLPSATDDTSQSTILKIEFILQVVKLCYGVPGFHSPYFATRILGQ